MSSEVRGGAQHPKLSGYNHQCGKARDKKKFELMLTRRAYSSSGSVV